MLKTISQIFGCCSKSTSHDKRENPNEKVKQNTVKRHGLIHAYDEILMENQLPDQSFASEKTIYQISYKTKYQPLLLNSPIDTHQKCRKNGHTYTQKEVSSQAIIRPSDHESEMKLFKWSFSRENNIHDVSLDIPFFKDKLIRDDEHGKIIYTQRGIIKFAEELASFDDYETFYQKNNLIISIKKNGSPISSEFPLEKTEYKIKKTAIVGQEISMKEIMEIIYYNPETRLRFDKATKSIILLEEGSQFAGSTRLLQCKIDSPCGITAEMETVEKEVCFVYDNMIYDLQTSLALDQNYIPQDTNNVRCTTLINLFLATSDTDCFYFLILKQFDNKMTMPDDACRLSLPQNVLCFFHNFEEQLNKKTLYNK